MTRKITTILLALALCLTLLPVGAGAATTDTYELKMNGSRLQCDNTDVTATNENLTVAGPQVTISGYVIGSNTGATYKLTSDVTIDKPLIITGGTKDAPVTLDLCGHVLKLNSFIYGGTAEGSVIAVKDGAYFVLQDSSPSEKHYFTKDTSNNLYKLVEDTSPNGKIELTGGVITGGTGTDKPDTHSSSKYGGGVLVGGGAHFKMTGGNIVGCRATTGPGPSGCGGGVYISNSATFNMTGGCIVGCAANDGGGVNATADSTFTLSGGAIRSCTASRDGGGGVTIGEGSTFTMENGTIEGCTASGNGGGVVIEKEGTFTMVNGTIKDCTATSGKGSGVYINGKATMDAQGGSVYDSVYICGGIDVGTLKNDSTGGGTAFYGGITNNSNTSSISGMRVTFMNGDDIHALSIVSKDKKVSEPAAPQKTGKTFLGWVTDDPTNTTHCKEFDFNTAVNDNLTLYAAWDGDFAVEVSGAGDGNGYYKTFDAAWSGAQGDSPTFKLLKDVDDVEDITCYRKGATLDLNGHKLTTANFSISGDVGEGNERVFTVEDTSSKRNGQHIGGIVVEADHTTLQVKGGTVEQAVAQGGGKVECAGGTITTAYVYDDSTLECAGGTITNLDVSGGTVNHTGGTATCKEEAKCSVCGHLYGEKNATNHAGTPDYHSNKDNHWQVYSCCGKETGKVAHTFGSDNKCECGYEKPRRTYRGSSTPTVSAVLSHPDAASATNYTSGIYGLTFRSTASFASFRGVQVDGKTIASSNYIAEEGSIVVYLKAVYLQTLSKGSHTVTILSTEGNTTANFTIGGVQSAKTGDAGVAIYALMALTSYTGTALVVRGRKRK